MINFNKEAWHVSNQTKPHHFFVCAEKIPFCVCSVRCFFGVRLAGLDCLCIRRSQVTFLISKEHPTHLYEVVKSVFSLRLHFFRPLFRHRWCALIDISLHSLHFVIICTCRIKGSKRSKECLHMNVHHKSDICMGLVHLICF